MCASPVRNVFVWRESETETGTETETETERDRDRQRQRETETETDRQRQRQRQTETQTETERERGATVWAGAKPRGLSWHHLALLGCCWHCGIMAAKAPWLEHIAVGAAETEKC